MKKKVKIQPAMMSDAETQALLDSLVKKMKRNGKYALLTFLCIVACFIMSVQFPKPFSIFFSWVVVVQFFIMLPALLIRWRKISQKLDKVVGENLTRIVLQEVFEVETYSAHDCLKKDFIEEMKLISRWENIDGGPYVSGKYKGRSFIFNEIKLDYSEAEQGMYHTVFCGPWIIIEHAQTLSSPIWVVPNTGKGKKRKYEPENTESGLKFSLFKLDRAASDVTPTQEFLELLEPFYTVLPGKKYMTFYENKLCVAIHYDRRTYTYSNRDLKDINELRKKFHAKTKIITDAMDELIKIDRFFNEI